MKIKLGAILGICGFLLGCKEIAPLNPIQKTLFSTTFNERIAAEKLESLRNNPSALRQFLQKMPKGADLHSHLSGAVTTERLIEWGAADGLCIDTKTLTATEQPCNETRVPLSNALMDKTLYRNILEAWSMEGFQGTVLEAHHHFFDAFDRFSAVLSDARADDSLADILSIAGKNQQIYVELMQGFNSSQIGNIASKYIPPNIPWTEANLLEKRVQLMADPVFKTTIEKTAKQLDSTLKSTRQLLNCDKSVPDPGCQVDIRFLLSANRTKDRGYVFAQWVYGYELVQASPWIVGVELVSPEEHPNSLQYYDDEMLALDVLHRFNQADPTRRPVRIALHAGELIPDVLPVTPEGQKHLTFHMRHAVEIGHAERIGHGSAILDETNPLDLMRTMREKGVLVEICLLSNKTLLGKTGETHPVNVYLAKQVKLIQSMFTWQTAFLLPWLQMTKEFLEVISQMN